MLIRLNCKNYLLFLNMFRSNCFFFFFKLRYCQRIIFKLILIWIKKNGSGAQNIILKDQNKIILKLIYIILFFFFWASSGGSSPKLHLPLPIGFTIIRIRRNTVVEDWWLDWNMTIYNRIFLPFAVDIELSVGWTNSNALSAWKQLV